MMDRYEEDQQFVGKFGLSNASSATTTINRTHRVVRERAKTIKEQKSRIRSLWIPLIVSFGFLACILFAVWSALDESELLADGIPDSGQNLMVLGLWCIPLSVIVMVVVWFRRANATSNDGGQR